VYLEKNSVEIQYLDNITKKNYLCSRRRQRRLGGLGGLGVRVGQVRQVRRVGVRAAPAEMWDEWEGICKRSS